MPTITKDLLHQGFNFATACYDSGIDATPLTTWLSDQARLGLTAPIAGTMATSSTTANPTADTGIFDQAVLAAVQSSPNGVAMDDLRPILAQYGKPNNQIGAALGRLMRKNLIAKNGNLWQTKIDKSLDTRRRTRTRGTSAGRKAMAANGGGSAGEAQPQAATG